MPYYVRVEQASRLVVGIQFTPKGTAPATPSGMRLVEVSGDLYGRLFTNATIRHRYNALTQRVDDEVNPDFVAVVGP